MADADALRVILAACERLRRIPEGRWHRPPQAPLGARAPQEAPLLRGDSLESLVTESIARLMRADAARRDVAAFTPDVSVFALPDVLAAVAKSASGHGGASTALQEIAAAAAEW